MMMKLEKGKEHLSGKRKCVCVKERERERDQYCIGMEPEDALAWEQSSLPQPPDLLDDIEICADKKKDIYLLHYLFKSF